VVGVVSGKGGVGKSTLAVNLAVSAASRSARVLLVDGDVGLANADLLMGLVPRHDLQDWVEGRIPLEEVACPGPAGVSLMLAGESRAAARALRDAIARGSRSVLGRYVALHDLTVVDLGAGIGSDVLELGSVCHPLWLVTTPEPTSLADAYATAKRLWQRTPTLEIELVVNRVQEAGAGERTHLALSRLTQRFLGRALSLRAVLPEQAELMRSVSEQTPLVLRNPRTAAARRLDLLAESLLEEWHGDIGSSVGSVSSLGSGLSG
jgi:flagellar biosynthesis protein FlhG